ncbi:peptidoglycan/xylan/chitin deacetylase (PgdA/CDA1 family) [Clostridium pascui]|uniref:polysaccharide deacetylase family protein n=1 Tax=Clostridium pascui TaxID=46609 RepID=UPI001A9CB39A|nr:polysaccharide deacetylase family protein [Clostridium pascui]MBM7870645.1 peptidoglycan/xylan/chitin deacetylase (PgdA/CDA1 family) [Clostridium pascui]
MRKYKFLKSPLYLTILIFLTIPSVYLIINQYLYINNSINNQQFIHKNNDKPINNSNNITTSQADTKNTYSKRNFSGSNLKHSNEGIPVLMYHSISNRTGNEIQLSKNLFEAQMKLLKDKNYTTLSLDELYDFINYNKPIPKKSVVLTFDDGYVDNYLNAYPILKKYNFRATIFVITDNVDKYSHTINSPQIKEMSLNGIDIMSHTEKHENLLTLTYDKQLYSLKTSKNFLEKVTNKKVDYIAYPYGKWNKDTLKAAQDAGYTMAFSTSGTWTDKSDGIYKLDRVYISSNFDLSEFERRLTNRNYNNIHSKNMLSQ